MSEVEKIFKGLCKRFNKANVTAERSYYFSLGDAREVDRPHHEGEVRGEEGEERRGRLLLQGPGRALPRRLERRAPARARRTSSPARSRATIPCCSRTSSKAFQKWRSSLLRPSSSSGRAAAASSTLPPGRERRERHRVLLVARGRSRPACRPRAGSSSPARGAPAPPAARRPRSPPGCGRGRSTSTAGSRFVYSSEAKIAIDCAFEAKLEGKVWTRLFLMVVELLRASPCPRGSCGSPPAPATWRRAPSGSSTGTRPGNGRGTRCRERSPSPRSRRAPRSSARSS